MDSKSTLKKKLKSHEANDRTDEIGEFGMKLKEALKKKK